LNIKDFIDMGAIGLVVIASIITLFSIIEPQKSSKKSASNTLNIKYLLTWSVIGVVVIALAIVWFFLKPLKSGKESVANTLSHQTLSEESQPVSKEIGWDELMPEGNRQDDILAKYQSRIDSLQDDSEESWQLYQAIEEEIANAPLNEKLNDQWIKLPGFIAPIELKGTLITEFLLVPYFGACIHVPPPPVNQIVLVKTAQGHGIKTDDAFQPVWVMGQISVQRKKTEVGEAGYRISEAIIAPYKNEFFF
jgi:hypothetical protein